MAKSHTRIIDATPTDLKTAVPDVTDTVKDFIATCQPLEQDTLYLLVDARTNARYCDCHVQARTIIKLSTIDVPLDPDEQPDYRANREIVEDAVWSGPVFVDTLLIRLGRNLRLELDRTNVPEC